MRNATAASEILGKAIVSYYKLREEKCFDRAAFLARYHEHAAALASFVDGIKDLEEIARTTVKSDPIHQGKFNQAPAEAPPVLDDYELLEELGRGGMGVVFKARQRSLGRLVAVKIILDGKFASADDIQRFRREAEVVASLDHSGIVPIYAIGKHEGRDFFSMKFMEGGTLASRKAEFSHPKAAAQVVQAVAFAVQHAHEHGILHRDLKPANILLDPEGNPHVGDFGLARPLGADSDLTRSGAAVGTPCYMAPEQAGAARRVSTAADVYSLGAILYELLTGAPPFVAESSNETIRLLKESEPIPPRRRNSAVHRDLDTICLKCLNKDAAKRYRSAEELAKDLERWLTGKPVTARRSPAWERAYRWVCRNPVLATLSAALAISIVTGLAIAGSQWLRAEREADSVRIERDKVKDERDTAQRERDNAVIARERANANFKRALEAIDFIGGQVGSVHLANIPRADKARREMIEYATRFIENFPEAEWDDPGLRRDKAMAYLRAGQFRVRLGESVAAMDAFRKAIALFEELHPKMPRDTTVGKGLIDSWSRLSEVLADIGKKAELATAPAAKDAAWNESARALARADEAFQKFDPTIYTTYDREIMRAGLLEGRLEVLRRARKLAEADAAGQVAHAIYEKLLSESPGDRSLISRLARLQGLRGWVQKEANRHKDARALYESGLAHFASLHREALLDPSLRAEAATARRNYAIFLRTIREHVAARAEYKATQQVLAQLVDDYPDVPYYRSEWAESLFGEALVELEVGQVQKARPILDQAVRLQREAFTAAKDRTDLRRRFVKVLMNAAQVAILDSDTDHVGAMNLLAELRPLAETGMDFSLAGQMMIACIQLVDLDKKLSADAKKSAGEKYTAEFVSLVERARELNHKEWTALLDNQRVREIPPHPALTRLLEARKTTPQK